MDPEGEHPLRHLLIDADLMAYRAASACQQNFDWGEGVTSLTTNLPDAKRHLTDLIDGWMDKLKADKLTICLSDDFDNFRKDVDPTYKTNRVATERPVHLYGLKDWLAEKYPHDRRRRLEADDVMGILATEPSTEERIIVSQDKDMQTIPGLLYRPFSEKPKVQDISLDFADRYHLLQTLMGDTVDGYSGCPDVGVERASQCLDSLTGFEDYEHEFSRGPRKGLTEIRWKKVELANRWDVVVSMFKKAGLTAKDALTQARLARILRHGEWVNGRPIMWSPAA